jgi:hypothetical protein
MHPLLLIGITVGWTIRYFEGGGGGGGGNIFLEFFWVPSFVEIFLRCRSCSGIFFYLFLYIQCSCMNCFLHWGGGDLPHHMNTHTHSQLPSTCTLTLGVRINRVLLYLTKNQSHLTDKMFGYRMSMDEFLDRKTQRKTNLQFVSLMTSHSHKISTVKRW